MTYYFPFLKSDVVLEPSLDNNKLTLIFTLKRDSKIFTPTSFIPILSKYRIDGKDVLTWVFKHSTEVDKGYISGFDGITYNNDIFADKEIKAGQEIGFVSDKNGLVKWTIGEIGSGIVDLINVQKWIKNRNFEYLPNTTIESPKENTKTKDKESGFSVVTIVAIGVGAYFLLRD